VGFHHIFIAGYTSEISWRLWVQRVESQNHQELLFCQGKILLSESFFTQAQMALDPFVNELVDGSTLSLQLRVSRIKGE
jgi:hypothetical protein